MAPKGKGADKGKNKDSGGAVKACQSISVRHILCEKHAKKELALAKLNDGIAFDVVAREYSEDKARTGGALGWKTRADLLPEFADIAFDLAQSNTAKPVWGEAKTSEGYHIMMVDGRK